MQYTHIKTHKKEFFEEKKIKSQLCMFSGMPLELQAAQNLHSYCKKLSQICFFFPYFTYKRELSDYNFIITNIFGVFMAMYMRNGLAYLSVL